MGAVPGSHLPVPRGGDGFHDGAGPRTDYDLGREAGRVDAVLEAYAEHFKVINGSIESSAVAITALGVQVRELREESRLREERALTAEQMRKEEAERRGAELQNRRSGDERRFSKRERLALVALGTATVLLSVVSTLSSLGVFG